jgi:hypothetical protein
MTALNLALRNLYGYALWGNSLAGECKLGYRTGMNMNAGFIRHLRPGELAQVLGAEGESDAQPPAAPPAEPKELPTGRKHDGPQRQFELF